MLLHMGPTGAPMDSNGAPWDSSGAPLDSTGAPLDSNGAPLDSTGAPLDSTGAPLDSTGGPFGFHWGPLGPCNMQNPWFAQRFPTFSHNNMRFFRILITWKYLQQNKGWASFCHVGARCHMKKLGQTLFCCRYFHVIRIPEI